MLYKIWEFIQMWLPFWLVVQIYKRNPALRANIRTRTGKKLKAVMITQKYGILFIGKDYLQNRVAYLKQQQDWLNNALNKIANEMNSLSFEAREEFFTHDEEES